MNSVTKHLTVVANLCRVFFGAVLCVYLLAGCATPPVVVKELVFFPPLPNAPRVQFLKSISTSKDVVAEKANSFTLFIKGETEEVKQIIKPYGVAYVKGKLYVCDVMGMRVDIIDLVHKKFDYLKGASAGFGKLKKPINLAVDDKGNIYVVDTTRKEVLMYDASGSLVKIYGKGIVNKPVDVAVDGTELYILDLGDNEIKVLDRNSGELIRGIGKTEGTTQGLAMPTNFAFDGKGYIYVTNISLGNVMKLDKDGHIISQFGKIGDSFGEFTRPKGIAVDSQEHIFVVDGGTQNAQIFNDAGRLLMFFGNPPLPAGALNLPVSIAVTNEDLDYFQKLAAPGFVVEQVIFVTNQQGNDKVSIYALGHMSGPDSSRQTGQGTEKKP
jgi:DNA-binding beta-propeller fold protein YncE